MTTTIGQRLKAAREDQRLTLDKVFESTRIRVQYLHALEEDDLSVMPSPVQARGYLRNYAEFLGLDVEKVLEELRESSTQKPSEVVIGPTDVPEIQKIPPEVDSSSGNGNVAVEESSPLVKPKPARRKKAVPPSEEDPATPSRQRRRKKSELEIQPEPPNVPVEQSIERLEIAADRSGLPEVEPAHEPVPQPVIDPESSQDTGQVQESPPAEAPMVPAASTPLEKPVDQPDVNDSLWQSWLNRLGSVLAARNRRRTLVVKETASSADSNPVEILETPVDRAENPPSEATDSSALQSSESSTQIFKEIGLALRERRELLSLHLEEVERNTHVKAHYLDALERGAMDELPSTVQTRGMLSNYATFLDLDVDALLLRFADALQARYRERNPQKPARKPGQPITANLPPMRSFIAGDLIFGVGIVVLLVGFAIWGVSRVVTLQSQQEVGPTAPSISEILLAPSEIPAFTETATLVPIESFPGEATVTVVIPTLNSNVNVQVNLIAAERTYMRVTVDGEVVFEGRVVPGTAYPYEAVDQVEVLAGSGAAIRVVYNGRDMGLLGPFGTVVSNIYRANEILTPTGMPTATGTVTPTPTNTVPPTATSRFTSTPAPSDTAVP